MIRKKSCSCSYIYGTFFMFEDMISSVLKIFSHHKLFFPFRGRKRFYLNFKNIDNGKKNPIIFVRLRNISLKWEIPTFTRLHICSSAFIQLSQTRETFSLLLCSTGCINLPHISMILIQVLLVTPLFHCCITEFKISSKKTLLTVFFILVPLDLDVTKLSIQRLCTHSQLFNMAKPIELNQLTSSIQQLFIIKY